MPERPALERRWLELTRTILPGLAKANGWPIALDHCFMRVFLDHAARGRWTDTIARPAIRHIGDAMLRDAIEAAERVIADPATLPELNHQSLVWRGHR